MEKFKLFIKSITACDTFLSALLSFICYVLLKIFIFGGIAYDKISDFYSGPSIYVNVSKYSDILFIWLYIVLFFIFICFFKIKKINSLRLIERIIFAFGVAFICSFSVYSCINTYDSQNFLVENYSLPFILFFAFFYLMNIDRTKIPVTFIQVVMTLGYSLIIPPQIISSGNISVGLVLIFGFIISLSLFDIIRRRKHNKLKDKISPFALAPILILLFGQNYAAISMSLDDHHFGEAISTFWSHEYFGAKYYKDIMLVHGYSDVLPMIVGKYIMKDCYASGYYLGSSFLFNLGLIIKFVLLYILFEGRLNFIVPSAMCYSSVGLFIPSYLLLIRNKIFDKKYLFLFLIGVCAVLFSVYRTSIGTAWLVAVLPAVIWSLIDIKNNEKYSKKSLICFLLFYCICFLILGTVFKDEIVGYLSKGIYYLKGNLIVFGNFNSLRQFWMFILKAFQYILTPFLIFLLMKEFTYSNPKRYNLLLMSFAIIYPLCLLTYSLGRVDNNTLPRSAEISYEYFCILLPLFIMINKERYQKFYSVMSKIFILISLIIIFKHSYYLGNMFERKIDFQPINSPVAKNLGTMVLTTKKLQALESIYTVVNKYSKSDDDFLDLSNHGLYYFYLNKKMPIPYVSFYNIISPSLMDEYVENFSPEKYRVILISPVIRHDNIYVSLRIPEFYRKILLSKRYFVLDKDEHVYLILSDNFHEFSKNELSKLDNILGNSNLGRLPEVWASSENLFKNLDDLNLKYNISVKNNDIYINFLSPVSGDDIEYIYFNFGKNSSLSVSTYGSSTSVECISKSGQVLIPFDNIPSWLLNKNVKSIKITLENNPKFVDVKFYKRK